MMPWSGLSVISDVAANIFAAFILILIILLGLSRANLPAGGADTPPTAIEATRDLRMVERTPLRAGEMVEMLRREPGNGALLIDLFESRIVVAAPGAGAPVVFDTRRGSARSALARLDASLDQSRGASAQLYVFSNRWYAAVTDRLGRNGISWREISVPVALRGASGAGAGDGWADAYLQLVARRLDREHFRPALARLLAGTGGGGGGGKGGGGLERSLGAGPFAYSSGPPGGPQESLIERIKRTLAHWLLVGALAIGAASVLWIERRHPRGIRLARPGK